MHAKLAAVRKNRSMTLMELAIQVLSLPYIAQCA